MSDKKSSDNKVIKKRNWAFVLYPESAPSNWRELLQLTGLECVISPLHNKDVNPDGTPKKPHFHIIICYQGPTSYNVVKSLCDSLNCPIPQYLESVKGYYRYLTHMDNPEKAQYSKDDIQTLNGFNILNYVEITKAEAAEYKRKIQTLIREKDIIEYCDLLDYLIDNSLFEELDIAMNNTLLFNNYIKSRKYKRQEFIRDNEQF